MKDNVRQQLFRKLKKEILNYPNLRNAFLHNRIAVISVTISNDVNQNCLRQRCFREILVVDPNR